MTEPMHWHREPAEATRRFVEAAAFTPTPKGLQLAIELIAYPAGHVQVATSTISGSARNRTIVQTGGSLMFNDANEAKDAVDLLLDRLTNTAQQA